ncbi:prostasin-like protein [Leptotrombidium deliense]|uniref:Prostasin-like protein n=1 Tax=Leptotrombidium deliense TaxID=299467 RepID=A0A443S857_9ACAR|nr:prostasin-like protein [Leptotrombidium deliense]
MTEKFIEHSACLKHKNVEIYYPKYMACFGGAKEGISPCTFDIGGALVVRKGDYFFQKGLLFKHNKCGKNGAPSVFLLLKPFRKWISDITELNFDVM